MAYTRSKKAPKKAKTRARKLALTGSARPRARPSAAAKRSTTTRNSTPIPTTTADIPSDTDEDLLDAANSLLTEVGKLNRSLERPRASFWKNHGSNIAVVIRRMPSFDRSRYQRVDGDDGDEDIPMDNTAATPPSSYKKVRFDRQVEQIGSSGGMSGILTAAKFGDSEDDESSSSDDTDEAELSEDELSESVRRMTRSSVNPIKPRNHGFAVVIKKSPAATPTPAASGAPRVTRHATTTRHQFRLAVTGNPAAVPSSMTTTEAVSVRSLIHSRIDDKYAASRTRATAATIAANRSAKASNAKRASTFTAGVVQKNTRATTVKRTSGRIAAKASKGNIVHVDDDDEEESAEESEEEEEDSDEE